MTDTLKHFLNTLYFTSSVDAIGKTISKYDGTVVAFTIRRDDGTEYEIREEKPAEKRGIKLTVKDMKALATGQKLLLRGLESVKVLKVYPDLGDVWVQSEADITKSQVVKYWNLTSVP